jgi:tetratricopeptide (TPR) repeat protein
LIIANSLAKKKDLTNQDRVNIAQAIQSAIREAKTAVILNPYKSSNWEGLASVYKSLLGVADGAEKWSISSYRKSISLDPRNPILRLSLGEVFFGLKDYKQAASQFERAVEIRPSMPNLHYNLAWAYYKDGRIQESVLAMQSALSLINDRESDDYMKASADLEEFKSKLPNKQEKPNKDTLNPEELKLPSDIKELDQKIELPEDAAPPNINEATQAATQ